jgi:hypothetical protein
MRAVVPARVWFRAVTGTAPTYIVHGLRVRSEVPLPVPALEEDGEPDLTVRWAEPRGVPDERPDGELRSEIEMGERRCWIVDDPDGHLVRCNLRCEFRLTPDRREVDVHLDPSRDPMIATELLLRNVLTLLLSLRESFVLHASAVQVGGRTLGIAGPPEAGKSSLAALFCADGAKLVTDDVLRVDIDGDEAICFPGPGAIRLRPRGAALATNFPAAPRTATIDGRIAVSPERAASEGMRLDALMLPRLVAEDAPLTVERLDPADAVAALGRASAYRPFPPKVLIRSFHRNAELVARLPVFRGDVPIGRLSDLGLPADLLRGMAIPVPA